MKLTEFLLARIAEDEADVEQRGTWAVGHSGRCIFEGGYEGTTSCDCGAVARALADYEAKRKVTETHRHADYSFGNSQSECPAMPRPLAESMILRDFAACDTLLLLAAVYAAHPDYQHEWRP